MSYIRFGTPPPNSKSPSTTFEKKINETEAQNHVSRTKSESSVKTTVSRTESTGNKSLANKYSLVKLDVDRIEDAMAARLATCLLGHILFLKGQVPFPVMQLSRIPGGKTNSRAAKQRAELLSSFDTISSHLESTFSALSTAFAKHSTSRRNKFCQAHLVVLLGPTITSAKSKVILAIDGLERKVWGSGEDRSVRQESDSEEEDDDDEASGTSSDDSVELPDDSDEEQDSEEEEDSNDDDDDHTHTQGSPRKSSAPPYISYAEQQKSLQSADRLLSRTLATADARGNGITSEMSPTQTHVLIRAPRRFNHPAWIPRQNVTDSLESTLRGFLSNSGFDIPQTESNNKASKIEGVWITTRSGILEEDLRDIDFAPSEGRDGTEDDDMIWWSWDGKLVGFSDW